ncbi:hypothetical protein J5N97_028767 [Dioscorea zingiberensis]|uniref:RING-type domain-containing protein n=1 Tax=Dioscorea zingiberensis TaxID=325984 RepID=A0A9D5H562_9LILI|nr:hypothetical protein J5N97_028767 [Dioscorea zingiberensis]
MDSPSPPDLDSTSELLGNLDLIERSGRDSLGMLNMDDMDIDLVLEVPDTPESVVRTRGSSFSAFNGDIDGGLNSMCSNGRAGSRKTYGVQSRDSSSSDRVGTGTARDDTELLFRQARLARLLSEDKEGKASCQTWEHNVVFNGNGRNSNHTSESHSPRHRDSRRRIEKELYTGHEGRDSFHLKHTDKGKGINLSSDSKDETKQTLSRGSQIETSHRNTGRSRLVVVHNSCKSLSGTTKSSISPSVGQNNVESVHGRTLFSSSGDSNRNVKKQVDVGSDSMMKTGQLRPKQLELACRNAQRRLVRNGCIAPCNITRDNNGATIKEDDFGLNMDNECSYGNSSTEVHDISPDSNDRHVDRKKGKSIMDDDRGAGFQISKVKSQSIRCCSMPIKEVISGGNSGGDTLKSSEDKCRRPTHNSQPSIISSDNTTNIHKSKNVNSKSCDTTRDRDCVDVVDGSPEITAFHRGYNPNPARELSDLVSEGRRSIGRQNLIRGKRKSSSMRSYGGECSSSALEEAEVLFVRSSAQPSNQRASRASNSQLHGCSVLKPILEVDELDSANIRSSDQEEESYEVCEDSSMKARQVETDEILARQLQEQLFNESPDLDEMDATIALSLQQEENSRRASSARRDQPHLARDISIAPVYVPPSRTSGRSSSARPTARSRVPASSRMAHLRRGFNRSARDLETRLNFLEALEAEFDNRNILANTAFQLQREFNENDYEMLLALDDNNEQAGASQSQINSLPQSVVQSDNFQESCAVCLENPSIGDIIRHLPCLHKFHKDCIDTWLKRKKSCPICKSGIT